MSMRPRRAPCRLRRIPDWQGILLKDSDSASSGTVNANYKNELPVENPRSNPSSWLKMAEILRRENPKPEILLRKWERVADEIETEAAARHHIGAAHLLMNLVEVSRKRFGVGKVRLRPGMCVLHIETPVEIEEAEIFRDAWLGFPDELETLLYLRSLWLRRIRRNVGGASAAAQDTCSLVERAMEICIRERGFANEPLETFILGGIRDMAGAEIRVILRMGREDSFLDLCAFDIDEKHGELKELVDGGEFDVHDQQHMALLEKWMSETAYPRGRTAAWEGADG